jgi:hypothetical protein
MDTATTASSAVQATEFSRMISALGPLGFDSHAVGTPSNEISEQSDVEKAVLKSHENKSDHGVKCCGTSALTPTRKNSDTHRENKEGCQCSRSSITVPLPEAEACLCYGCRLIAREMVCIKVLNPTSHYCTYCIENIMIYTWWCGLI